MNMEDSVMSMRIGFGTDRHRLVPGDGLWIGGVKVPCDIASVAASDGDALLHALADALLGAGGLGDIGDHYPESRIAPGAASAGFITEILALLADKRLNIVNVDLVVDLERPKLGDWKNAIRDNIASLLKLDASRVNVKAKSGEGVGPIGRGEAIGAQAIALLETDALP